MDPVPPSTVVSDFSEASVSARPGANRPKLRFVDALRGLAIFGVLLVHCTTASNPIASSIKHDPLPRWLVEIGRSGARGVQLFYLISAFTLFLSMSRRTRREKRPFLNFFIRRFARIAPMFYVAVALCLLVWGGSYQAWRCAPNVSLGAIISTLTFTNQLHPYWISALVPGGWSVAVEMSFYLVVPLLFMAIRTVWWALGLTLLALILSISLNHAMLRHTPEIFKIGSVTAWNPKTGQQLNGPGVPVRTARAARDAAPVAETGDIPIDATVTEARGRAGHTPSTGSAQSPATATTQSVAQHSQGQFDAWKTFLFFWLPSQLPVFCLGFIFYFMYPHLVELDRTPALRYLGTLMLLIAALMLWRLPTAELENIPHHFEYGVVFLLLATSLALYENPLLVNRFWIYLGKVSYSAYLLHFLMLMAAEAALLWLQNRFHFFFPPIWFLVTLLSTTLGLTLIAASISFWLIEQPGQALGKRLIDKLEGRPTRQSNLPESPGPLSPAEIA